MDRIFLENLRLDCLIGVTEEERGRPQRILLDVGLFLDLSRPAASGNLAETIDYREAKELVSRFVSSGEFNLLESLAEQVASLALREFKIERVVVRARKEKYSAEPSIGVEVDRARSRTTSRGIARGRRSGTRSAKPW